jgi:hypothetical protein
LQSTRRIFENPHVIYCVIPAELADELYERLADYYRDNSNVEVIIDRRSGGDRRQMRAAGGKRVLRDRRRVRAAGTFLPTDEPRVG